MTTLAAGAAAVIARTVAARSLYAGLGAALLVAFVGVLTRKPSGPDCPPPASAAAVAAGAVVLFGVYVMRTDRSTGAVLECSGAAAALAGVVVAAGDEAGWPARSLPSCRWRRWVRCAPTVGWSTGAPPALWRSGRSGRELAAAGVGVVEAYTAPAAAAALAAGILQWRSGPGRSWITSGRPCCWRSARTLLLGMADDDAVRLVVAALLALVAVVVGGVLRLQAPLCLGAVALLSLALDQWAPRSFGCRAGSPSGVVGGLLMWIGATFRASPP